MGHTKGNWSFQTTHNKIEIFSFVNGVAETDIINSCLMNGEDVSTDDQISNAKLMSAAPDMLEILTETNAYYQEMYDNGVLDPRAHGDWNKIKAAIKKATE